ncbi:GTPase domain-containing protein [Pseudonocardia sp. TRM90224]|uniref:GTPase domain-containing protein n=1 Tax=Pseudonocardia sp. TRM90224 TaxID=2812678 RepID=UPI001E34556C|nr:GTPase domain-containing protein [Pseudonocardia sp. TRM90224]
MAAVVNGGQEYVIGGLVAIVVTAVLVVPMLLVVVPLGLLLGTFGSLAIIVARLATGAAPTPRPVDDAVAADPVEGTPGDEPAWRSYLGAQAIGDARDAGTHVKRAASRLWDGVRELRDNAGYTEFPDSAVVAPLWLVPFGFGVATTAGAAVGSAASGVVVGGVTGTMWTAHRAAAGALRLGSTLDTRRRGAGATCVNPECLGHTTTPIVQCRCGRFHRTLRPGAFGAFRRRCVCGALLPTTIAGAVARGRLALRCPWCNDELPPGSMIDRNVRLVVTGAPGSGVSTLADAGLHAVMETVTSSGGSVSRTAGATGAATRCTAARLVWGRRAAVVTVLDAPGAVVASDVELARLHLLRDVSGIVLVIDATALPRPASKLGDGPGADPEITYRTIAGRLRDDGVDLRKLPLAIALSKADQLDAVLPGRGPAPGSAGVQDWLARQGQRSLVAAAERDFGAVRYYLTSADGESDRSPGAVVAWLLRRAGVRVPT